MTSENTQTEKPADAKATKAAEAAAAKAAEAKRLDEELNADTPEGVERATAGPEDDGNRFPEDHFLVEQLVQSSSSFFEDQYPNFLVSAALHADGKTSYTVDEAKQIVSDYANQKVEG